MYYCWSKLTKHLSKQNDCRSQIFLLPHQRPGTHENSASSWSNNLFLFAFVNYPTDIATDQITDH